ncbi:MAG: hypothetical protein AABZ44_02670 [Elusimicrobiota bacterium]
MIEPLQGLLTLVIGIATVCIMVLQYRIEKSNNRHLTYERKVLVYKASIDLIEEIIANATPKFESISSFVKNTAEQYFLFDKNIQMHLDSIKRNAYKLHLANQNLRGNNYNDTEQRKQLAEENRNLLQWFYESKKVTVKVFESDLKI